MIKSRIISKLFLITIIILGLYSINSFAQDVIVFNVNGERVKGTIVEKELTIKTETGEIKIPVKEIALMDFVSSSRQVSAKAYLHLLRGRELAKSGFNEEALDELKTAVSQAPQYIDALFELSKLLYKTGAKNEAMESFAKIINEDPDYPEMDAYFKDVADWYLVNKKDNAKAADIYLMLFTKYPKDKNAQYAVYKAGFLYAWELKDNKKAISTLESAVKAFPDDTNAEKAIYEIGRLNIEEGNLDSAESYFNQIISKYPYGERVDNAHLSLATIYQRKNQYLKAVNEIEKVTTISTDQELIASARKLLDELAWNIYGILNGLPSDNIHSIVLDKDILWIGTSTGVVKFDTKTDTVIGGIILPNTDIASLAIDDSSLWIGTYNSWIKQYDKLNGNLLEDSIPQFYGDAPRILSMCVNNDSVWVGTESGIYQYHKINKEWKHYSTLNGLPDDKIISLASAKGVWCGTLKKGISVYDYSTGKWIIQPKLNNKSVPVINLVGNNVWFAWYSDLSNGISRYDQASQSWKDWTITEWEADADLTNGVNSSMIRLGAGENEVWLGTDSVTIFYNYQTLQWSDPLNYPSLLLGNTPSSIVVDKDSVWFATANGLGRLNKKVLSNN